MVEYINSNDDAGNLAIYGGLAAAAFAGGAALAYRATSPIYKNKNKDIAEAVVEPKGILTKFDDNGGKNPANFNKGALRSSTLGLLSSSQRERGFSEMAQSVADAATRRNISNLQSGKGAMGDIGNALSDFGNSYKQGIASLGSDLDKASAMLGTMSPADATKQFIKENPNSLIQEEDLIKRANRKANAPIDWEARDLNKYAELKEVAAAKRQFNQLDRAALQDEWTKAADSYYNSDSYKRGARQQAMSQKQVSHEVARDIQAHKRQTQNTANARAARGRIGGKGKAGKIIDLVTS